MVWANSRRMVVRYGIVAEVKGPTLRNSGSGIPDPEFRSKLILPWNDLIPTCVPPEPGKSAEYPEFQKMRPGRNRNKKRNAHPRRWHDFRHCDQTRPWQGRTPPPPTTRLPTPSQDPSCHALSLFCVVKAHAAHIIHHVWSQKY